jgi:putative transcriptional regulator
MKDDLFRELEASVREGGSILRGERSPSRSFVVDGLDVKHVRAMLGLSQMAFATMMGISVKTLRNWEQGRRNPGGAARVLLQVATRHPEAIWDVVRPGVAPPRRKSASRGTRASRSR